MQYRQRHFVGWIHIEEESQNHLFYLKDKALTKWNMVKETPLENTLEILSGSLLLALVLLIFVEVGSFIYSGVALLTTILLLSGFLYKLKYRKFGIVFFVALLFSPILLIIMGFILVGAGAILGGALGSLAGLIGIFLGGIFGGIAGLGAYYILQAISYLIYLIAGILILLQGLNYVPAENLEVKI